MKGVIVHNYFISEDEEEKKALFNRLIAKIICRLETNDSVYYTFS